MLLTKEQLEKRITSEDNISNKIAIREQEMQVEIINKDGINNHKGNPGTRHLTEEERVAIGVVASVTGSSTAAELFGVSPSHAGDLKNGNRNVGNGEHGSSFRVRDTELQNKIAERLEDAKLTIQEKAAEKLLATLGLLTEDKMENSSAKEIATVASQVSQVFRNMNSTNNKDNNKTNVKITVHQPKTSKEDYFETLEIVSGR